MAKPKRTPRKGARRAPVARRARGRRETHSHPPSEPLAVVLRPPEAVALGAAVMVVACALERTRGGKQRRLTHLLEAASGRMIDALEQYTRRGDHVEFRRAEETGMKDVLAERFREISRLLKIPLPKVR